MTKQQILDEARKLPPAERTDLALDLWEMVDARGLPLSPEMGELLDQRIAEDDAYSAPAEPVDVVVAKVLRGEH